MKSRRVLQVIVAVLSFAVLVCLLLSAVLVVVANHIDVIPKDVQNWAQTFKTGLKNVAATYNLPSVAVPLVAFGAPALLLVLAVILILTKSNGKDAKNNVGCVFALIGVFVLALSVFVFAKKLFAESFILPVCLAFGILLALFIIFVGCALGVKPKKAQVDEVVEMPAETAVAEESEEAVETVSVEKTTVAEESGEEVTEPTESCEVEEVVEEESEIAPSEDVAELNRELAIGEKVREAAEETEEDGGAYEDTPATQYVPHPSVSIRDVVDDTYGKENDSLSAATLQKINKVRALYDAKVITEQEYIKLINKYLGF